MQDPYCKVYLGGQYQRSSTCQSGGKDPHWNDRMFFTVPFGTDPMMKVEVMDNDAFEDDVIGYGAYNIAQFLQTRMNTTSKTFVIQLWSILSIKISMLVELPLEFNSEELWV